MAIKTASSWYSPRVDQEVNLVRWGHYGTPVLLFPTAGGDAEEIERMHMIGALGPLIEAGRIKVYSCDSIAGRALAAKWGSQEHRCWLLNGFEEYVANEVVPAIRTDCASDHIEPIVAGASIGAFKATAMVCRYPWLFRAAIGMSGTYDLEKLLGFRGNGDYYLSAPLAFLPGLEGPLLNQLRGRFVLLAYGEGRWENPDDSWRLANLLGAKGIPNRVDPWGSEWDHDWTTWREMLPKYLHDMVD
ncbi:MAG: alpha/beta hydrolase-fold protein [Pseudomonadota bacterium]